MCVSRRINATAVELNETSVHLTLACWACWGFWPNGSFQWEKCEMINGHSSVAYSAFHCVCVCVCIMWSCSDHVINPNSGQHFTPGCWICKFSLDPLSSDCIKNQLVIRFCAAAGYVVSFFLRATVGVWNGQAGKENGIHVRSTQGVPKLDHVSAPNTFITNGA